MARNDSRCLYRLVRWRAVRIESQPDIAVRGPSVTPVSVDVVVRDQPARLSRSDRRRLHRPRRRQAAADRYLHVSGDHRPPRKPLEATSILAGVEERLQEEVRRAAGAAPSTAAAATVSEAEASSCRSPAPGAVVRHQLDAAGGRPARGRLRHEVRAGVDVGGRPGLGGDHRVDAQRPERLHRRARGRARGAQGLAYSDGTAVPPVAVVTPRPTSSTLGEPRPHRRRASTRSTTMSGCGRSRRWPTPWHRSNRKRRSCISARA